MDEAVFLDAVSLGLRYEFGSVGSASYSESDVNGNQLWRLEGDSKGKPNTFRPETDFPTLVIESGKSQGWPSLRMKAQMWFEKSCAEVKIVLLVKVVNNSIHIEKWVPKLHSHRTRRGTMGQCVNEIRINRCASSDPCDPASYTVVGGPLSLEFSELMLRNPGSAERDLVISNTELKSYAAGYQKNLS